jgi:hypothetical protein
MNPWTHIPRRPPGRFRIGDRVRLRGYGGIEAEILEDHGSLGGDQRFYTVLVKHMGGVEDTIGGYPEDDMEPLAPADRRAGPG